MTRIREKLELTDNLVENLRAPDPSGKQTIYWDNEMRGFGVLVSKSTTSKSYFCQRMSDGKSFRQSIGFTNEIDCDEARGRAKIIFEQINGGLDPRTEKKKAVQEQRRERASFMTLQDALDGYLAKKDQSLRPATKSDYRFTIEKYLRKWLDTPLRDITQFDVEERHRAIPAECRAGSPGLSSANHVFRVFKLLWNYGSVYGAVSKSDNPTQIIEWNRIESRTRIIPKIDLAKFYAAVNDLENPIHRDLIKLLMWTGRRRGEASSMQWEHIDFEERVIRLPGHITKTRNIMAFPMSEFLNDLLKARKEQGIERGGWVFPANSKTGHVMEIKFALGKVREITGFEITAHDLRRTYVTIADSCRVPRSITSKLVGHSSDGSMTGQYSNPDVADLREDVETISLELVKLTEANVDK